MAVQTVDWDETWTLDDYLAFLFRNRQTETAEFKVLLRIYGRPRMEEAWKKFLEKNKK